MGFRCQRYLRDTPMCHGCIQWKFEAAETWGLRFDDIVGHKLKAFKPKMTDAAVWEPTNGLVVLDAVFPHIAYGFRNKTLPIAIFHVRFRFVAPKTYFHECSVFEESTVANCDIQRSGRSNRTEWHRCPHFESARMEIEFYVSLFFRGGAIECIEILISATLCIMWRNRLIERLTLIWMTSMSR